MTADSHLLLLPLLDPLPPSSNPSARTSRFRSLHGPLLTSVLTHLSSPPRNTPQTLLLALCTNIPSISSPPTPPLPETLKETISHLYSLIVQVTASLRIPSYGTRRIEINVVLYKPGPPFASTLRLYAASRIGILTSLRDIAKRPVKWGSVFSVDTARGRRDRDDFLRLYDQKHNRHSLDECEIVVLADPLDSLLRARGIGRGEGDGEGEEERESIYTAFSRSRLRSHEPLVILKKFDVPSLLGNAKWTQRGRRSVALGGTFDHLHVGHKVLLSVAVLVLQLAGAGATGEGEERAREGGAEERAEGDGNVEEERAEREEPVLHLRIGLTAQGLLATKAYADVLESWDQRAEGVLTFLRSTLQWEPTVAPPTQTSSDGKRSLLFYDTPPTSSSDVAESATEHDSLLPRRYHSPSTAPGSPLDSTGVDEVAQPNGAEKGGRLLLRVDIVRISDPFGPTVTDPSIETLVVSRETVKGADAINEKRKDNGWRGMEIVIVDVVGRAQDDGDGDATNATTRDEFESKLSSTAIRKAIEEDLSKPNGVSSPEQ